MTDYIWPLQCIGLLLTAALIGGTILSQLGKAMTPNAHTFPHHLAALFSIGLVAALSRRNAIFILIGIEMMLAAANLNFVAFWRFGPQPESLTGVMFVIFSIGVAQRRRLRWVSRSSSRYPALQDHQRG